MVSWSQRSVRINWPGKVDIHYVGIRIHHHDIFFDHKGDVGLPASLCKVDSQYIVLFGYDIPSATYHRLDTGIHGARPVNLGQDAHRCTRFAGRLLKNSSALPGFPADTLPVAAAVITAVIASPPQKRLIRFDFMMKSGNSSLVSTHRVTQSYSFEEMAGQSPLENLGRLRFFPCLSSSSDMSVLPSRPTELITRSGFQQVS